MSSIIIAVITSFVASFSAIKLIKPFANKIGLVDTPNGRKRHSGEVPLIGGIAVFMGVLTSCSILYPNGNILNLYLISSALIVFVGVLDDYRELPVSIRLVAQIIVSSIMVYGADVHIVSFGNILGLGELHLGWLGYPITIIAVLAAINAFNMVDGIDGLAGLLSLVSFTSLAILMISNSSTYSYLPLILAFATLPYLAFNLGIVGGQTKKIFMGDAGSMFVGLSVVWLLVLGTQVEEFAFRAVTSLWIIAIPLWDMCAITLRRIAIGRSPFKPDREHLHHIFLRLGYSSTKSLIIILSLSIVFSALGLIGEWLDVPEYFMFTAFIVMFAVYYYILKIIRDINSQTEKQVK